MGGAGSPARGSPPRGRVRAVVFPAVRRAGLCQRAPGGGEAGAARTGARARSAPPARRPPRPSSQRRHRRARSQHWPDRPPRVPHLRPVFLWARQLDGTVQEVRCEDYDPRNRIRIARTALGWRVIPRTEIYNSIRLPPPPPPRERCSRDRRKRRYGKAKRRPAARVVEPWSATDLESDIPSHTIAIPRREPEPRRSPSPPPPAAEPTPLDNLLAVAELEFHQQQGKERELELELSAGAAPYAFLPDEEVARDVMSFDLGEPPKQDAGEIFFEKPPDATVADVYPATMSVHKDLFETISEAHYLPDLAGPHDEELLESLVEKGCEDNHVLGQALDKLAHLVAGADYVEEEDDMMLGGAPVADIIDRLEHELSPGRSSMTAAQGLLHLHHIADHLPSHDVGQQPAPSEQDYMSDDVFTSNPPPDCALQTLAEQAEAPSQINRLTYEHDAEKRLENVVATEVAYTTGVPEIHDNYQDKPVEELQTLPDRSDLAGDLVLKEEVSDSISEQVLENPPESDKCAVECESAVPPEVATMDFTKLEPENSMEAPTDLSIKHMDDTSVTLVRPVVSVSVTETNSSMEDNMSEKSDEQPRDLSTHRRLPTPHASPRRLDIPRAPSRESDAMQSPQPSGIPAVPSSPELFTVPPTKSKQTLFLETLLSSPSPKMYTSEVTITKQQCEPLNLGKHRKSASPTVSSCSDEIRKVNKDYGEPQEKRIRRESTEELAKISKVFTKSSDDHSSDCKAKKPERPHKPSEENSPLKQLQLLKSSPDFNIPDPLLVPKDKLNDILSAPSREIPALLIQRPELRLPEAFAYPAVLQDPDILVISLSQLETIIENDTKLKSAESNKPTKSISSNNSNNNKNADQSREQSSKPDQTSQQPKPIPSMDALAGDIDAATSAALNQMLWLPYLSQLEAAMACSQNMDFLKALNSSGYTGANYPPELSQMFSPSSRFMGPGGFPMMPSMDYDNRLQFAMWQEAMSQANAASRSKAQSSVDAQMKEIAKSSDVQNPYVHSTKNHQSKSHSSARTSPIAHNYNNTCQRGAMNHNPFLQGMYPTMNPNVRPNVPLPGLQIPYFNPNMMGSQRSPRTNQQKSPTSPYYQNNNYLQSLKQSEGQNQQRSSSSSSQESPRPRISVKSLQNLLDPAAAAAQGGPSRRHSSASIAAMASMGRRREEPEVGSTTPLGETPPQLPPHPHDPIHHLWHPLFGNLLCGTGGVTSPVLEGRHHISRLSQSRHFTHPPAPHSYLRNRLQPERVHQSVELDDSDGHRGLTTAPARAGARAPTLSALQGV